MWARNVLCICRISFVLVGSVVCLQNCVYACEMCSPLGTSRKYCMGAGSDLFSFDLLCMCRKRCCVLVGYVVCSFEV